MPAKKLNKRKRNYVRRYRHRRKLRRTKSLIPSVYYFTRSQVFNVDFSTLATTTPQGNFYNYHIDTERTPNTYSAVAQFRFSLNQVTDWTEFSNLFSMYKIPAVSLKLYPSCGLGGGNTRDNSQMIVYTMPSAHIFSNQGGATSAVNEEDFLTSQVCKKQLLLNNNSAHPLTFYMKTRQAIDSTWGGTTQPLMVKPKWIPFYNHGQPTEDLPETVPHYGVTQRIQPVNNTTLPNVTMKCVVKYYIMCKQVR